MVCLIKVRTSDNMILTEFDENRNAVFNPHNIIKRKQDFPKIGITCFSKKIIDKIVTIFNGEKIAELDNLNGKLPIYKIKYKKLDIAIYMSYVGSPACVMEYEDILIHDTGDNNPVEYYEEYIPN